MVCAAAPGGGVDRGQGVPLQAVLGLLPVCRAALPGEHQRGGSPGARGKICAGALAEGVGRVFRMVARTSRPSNAASRRILSEIIRYWSSVEPKASPHLTTVSG